MHQKAGLMFNHMSQNRSATQSFDQLDADKESETSNQEKSTGVTCMERKSDTARPATQRLSNQPCKFRDRSRNCSGAKSSGPGTARNVCRSDNMAHSAVREGERLREERRLPRATGHLTGTGEGPISGCRFRSHRLTTQSVSNELTKPTSSQAANPTATSTTVTEKLTNQTQHEASTARDRGASTYPHTRPNVCLSRETEVQRGVSSADRPPKSSRSTTWNEIYMRCTAIAKLPSTLKQKLSNRWRPPGFVPLARVKRLTSRLRGEEGFSTAEYAVGLLAAVGLAGLLHVVLTSDTVQEALESMVSGALS